MKHLLVILSLLAAGSIAMACGEKTTQTGNDTDSISTVSTNATGTQTISSKIPSQESTDTETN